MGNLIDSIYSNEKNPTAYNLAKKVFNDIELFEISVQSGFLTPEKLLAIQFGNYKLYNEAFKKNVLLNEKSRHGIYVNQCKTYNHNVDNFILDRFDFKVVKTKDNNFTKLDYTFDKYFETCKMEMTVLLSAYGAVYDFQLKEALLFLLITKFNTFERYSDMFVKQWAWKIEYDVVTKAYNKLLELDFKDLPEVDKATCERIIEEENKERVIQKLSKPLCAEDLTCLFEEGMTLREKQMAICNAFPKCSFPTAKRWMAKYGLLLKSNKDKHEEKLLEMQESIDELSDKLNEAKEEMISVSKLYYDAILNELRELRKENLELKKRIESLEETQKGCFNNFNFNTLNDLTI